MFLRAWSAWRPGDAGLAGIATDGVLRQDPGHRPAAMLLALLWLGVDPVRLPPLAGPPVTPGGAP